MPSCQDDLLAEDFLVEDFLAEVFLAEDKGGNASSSAH
jgi:hypothetical protein